MIIMIHYLVQYFCALDLDNFEPLEIFYSPDIFSHAGWDHLYFGDKKVIIVINITVHLQVIILLILSL